MGSSVHLCTIGPSRGVIQSFSSPGIVLASPPALCCPPAPVAVVVSLAPWGLQLARVGAGRTPPISGGTLGVAWLPPLPGDAF